MALMKIWKWPEVILSTKTTEVVEVDDSIRKLLKDMAETMYSFKGIGLAAPQVGKSLRVCVVDVPEDEELPATGLLYLVNPKIVKSTGECLMDEGCLSFPGIEVAVRRAEYITVEYIDQNGVACTINVEGLASICLQHEIDHLDGITMVDRVGAIRRKLALRDYAKACQKAIRPDCSTGA
jgi:peptide deformylase